MTRSKWFRIGVVAVAAVAVLGLLVGTFQFVQDDQNSAAARPEECEGSSAAAAESQECREALLLQDLDVDEPAALGELDDAARIRVATALCAQGAELGDSSEAKPLRDQLYGQVAEAEKVSTEAVSALVPFLDRLCAGDANVLESLPATSAPASVTYEAFGTGAVTVEYTGSEGHAVTEEAFVPWFLPISLRVAGDVEMTVKPRTVAADGVEPAAGLGCAISVGTKVVSRSEAGASGGSVKCSASRQDVVAAANAAPTAGP